MAGTEETKNQKREEIATNHYYYYYIHLTAFFPGQPV